VAGKGGRADVGRFALVSGGGGEWLC